MSSTATSRQGAPDPFAIGGAASVGIIERDVTEGEYRQAVETLLQKTPVCCKWSGRPIIPGRIGTIETQALIRIGGAQVRPRDTVGCHGVGIVVVLDALEKCHAGVGA